jgi:AmmeMemoRadiSam system radical SAM enzyme/AmmeMemoRadiSam system protein B/AmmeMemoRadiSam system protein A
MKPQTANATLADVLDQHTAVGSLTYPEDDRIRCVACGHRCLIGVGKRGICKVRFNDNGQLRVPFGYVAGLQCDPVEKKPFFHVYPSSDALTFGMMGCDLHCSYCQNWVTSQALRDPAASAPVRLVSPAQLVETAQREGARLVVSSYNEPLITAEWAVAVFAEAKAAGLACAFVSNGNATPEVLDFLAPWIVAYKVDLKSFDDAHYRSLGGMLANITDTILMIHERGIWLEVVTLVIPGFNDSEGELREMARFLASVSRDIPWHVTAFHKDYHMTDPAATSPKTLMRAAELGASAGLRYVYAGNLPGQVGPWENTRCPGCGDTLIERYGYLICAYRLTANGCCPRCRTALPGIWPGDASAVRTGNDRAAFVKRLPRPVATAVSQTLPIVSEPDAQGSRARSKRGEESAYFVRGSLARDPKEGAQPMASVISRTELTIEQQQHLVAATRELVRGLAMGEQITLSPSALAGMGDHVVAGVFVSLKRGKHLRSCCGMMGKPIALLTALQEAATRTVFDDVRFPQVSPSELDHLDMEVWLLHSPEPVQATGLQRAEAVTVGRHGIQVVRGQQHGLFLPSVALDNQWDSKRFLDQVCIKAGLHASSWQDDATALFTFEGDVLRCSLADAGAASRAVPERRAGVCRPEDVRAYADFCSGNINALLQGATPSYFFVGAPDGNVNGVILTLQQAQNAANATHFCQLSLRPGVPLQSTLFALCQNAAQMVAKQRPGSGLEVRVAILHDPVLHGTAQEADLAGIDPRHRAILVMEGNKSAVVFGPSRQPAESLAEAVRAARVTHPASAPVFSLDALALAPFTYSTAPRPVRGHADRPPAVAGSFYPADAAELGRMVDGLLQGEAAAESWPAALVPHAGLVYSGRLAAQVLKRLQIPRTVIVLGPKHTALGMEWAVAPHQSWTFPGGSLESDFVLARQLCEAIPGLEMDAAAHQREHAIEVELPLLARLAPQARVVGLAIGSGDLASCQRFAEGLAGVLKARADRPLLLISSDMNHYATDAENRRLDALALAALERLDPAEIYETVTQNHISMCGLLPAVIVLQTLRLLGGLHKAERVGYATSADVTGDRSRVVGYAGMLFG